MTGLKEEVSQALKKQGSPAGALPLWEEIHAGYERGGSDAVWNLLEGKVKAIRRAAKVEASEMKAAAGSVKVRARTKRKR
ncbi:MAG TPA: hypothetical protein VGV89_08115 [Thermoplasmata archaeon]|nr:hypothetical protein [Thermoplasmata archaeon]